jgi:hypothetical protein
MLAAEQMQELLDLCGDAREMSESGKPFIYFSKLKLPCGVEVEGLLCPENHSGYATRLFLSQVISGRGSNWTTHYILGKTWYSWSWKDVDSRLRLAQMLAEHLRALR